MYKTPIVECLSILISLLIILSMFVPTGFSWLNGEEEAPSDIDWGVKQRKIEYENYVKIRTNIYDDNFKMY